VKAAGEARTKTVCCKANINYRDTYAATTGSQYIKYAVYSKEQLKEVIKLYRNSGGKTRLHSDGKEQACIIFCLTLRPSNFRKLTVPFPFYDFHR
jgi:hypothetical protein